VELDASRCYRAFLAHDRRFDGRVFAGVVTTGVYCRPVCRVRPPKFENTRFFACAAAAEAAGFRPCRRCRPETSPGTPAWIGTSAVVSRAFRLICTGALDEGNVEALAARVGLGGRQLRRLFAQHLGASPAEIARSRRAHFARTLIDQTTLPAVEIATAAGFRSVRQFNHAIHATFGGSPSALRRRRSEAPADGGGLILRLPVRRPFAWTAMLDFLGARATPGVEAVVDETYRRTIEVNGAPGVIEARADRHAAHLLVRVELAEPDGLALVVDRTRRLFDLDADPHVIGRHLRRVPVLAPLVRARPGLRIPGAWDPFELAVRAIVGQQVSVQGATTLAGRLARTFGRPVALGAAALTHLFPTPEALADADIGRIGLPRARAASIRALASAVARGALVLDAARGLEEAEARLTAIPGVGAWTAAYVAMRALGEPDAFPAGDLGLRRALGNGAGSVSEKALAAIAESWRPWRGYAAMYLWMTSPDARTALSLGA
jgi:AraC family transcriptional regulator of adaptative response / DNA-3-methyladenine glycosylase II